MSTRAFTLIEVLVSILIAGVCAASLFRSAHALLRDRSAAEELTAMTAIAAQSLEEAVSADPAALSAQDLSDEIAEGPLLLQRRRIVEAGQRENLWHLRVTVTNRRDGSEVSLHTLLRRPWS